ncbi:MAG: hypothetical protein M0Q14_03055 [Tissierellaceae bacterium]|nr:hypothetical protein [Tissierellaceae bacterium]
MFDFTITFFILLFISSIFGYIFAILKEKLYLKNNIILIDKKAVKEEHLNEADMKEFLLDGLRVKAGDEIKVVTRQKKKYNGILIGAKKVDKSILMVTHQDEIKLFKIDNILKFKVISKYGKFF